jgi:lipoprotein-releasing system permease protein
MRLITLIARRFTVSLRRDPFARFTSVVSIASVAIGCLALIISISVLNGYEELILETATRYTSHVEVRSIFEDGIHDADRIVRVVRGVPDVERVDSIMVREALARTRSGVDGVMLHGMSEERLSLLLGQGRTPGVYVGHDLGRRLGLTAGDTLVIYARDMRATEGSPILFALPIDGIVRTGMQSIDESMIAMPIERLASLLRQDVTPSLLAITLASAERSTDVSNQLTKALPPTTMVLTWQERFATIASWIELQKKPVPIVLGLIGIVAVFTLISTLLVTVVEKTRSLAILIALGMTARAVMSVIALRAFWTALMGSLIGVVISFAFAFVQNTWSPIQLDGEIYYVDALPVSYDLGPYILVPTTAIALALLAALVPMVAARRIRPARALRFS